MNAPEPLAARPLVIIGAGRSGTNMLRDCLTRLDGVVTWPCDEINYIWRHGNRAAPTDELDPGRATPSVRHYIRDRFDDIARESRGSAGDGKPFVVEKTCANSLRVPFVDAVLPEARYLYIVRDGRDVVASARRRWKAPLDLGYILAKARYVPASDLPYYASRYALNRLDKLRAKDAALSVWGPRFEGMRELAAEQDLDAVCAAQWARCVELSDAAFDAMAPERVMRLRYEDFVRAPAERLEAIGRFAGRDIASAEVSRAIADVNVVSIGKGAADVAPDTLAFMSDTLARHGYS